MRFDPPWGTVPPWANTPTNARCTLLFWMVILEKKPAVPRVVPSEMTTADAVLAPLITTQFFRTSFVIGVVPTEPNQITLGEVVLVLVMVRLRSVPPLFE